MNSRQVRAAMKAENSKWPVTLREIPRDEWPRINLGRFPRLGVWRSRDFLVQLFDEHGVVRISVNRTMIKDGAQYSAGQWEEDISWDDLQSIKRQVGYGERQAVELYPADANVVNVANMRHLWVLPEALPIEWK